MKKAIIALAVMAAVITAVIQQLQPLGADRLCRVLLVPAVPDDHFVLEAAVSFVRH